jgi:hypothetical protein
LRGSSHCRAERSWPRARPSRRIRCSRPGDVSIGLLGLLGKTIEVNHDTLIQVNGREARFADLQEGAKVKAFYEERGAKLVGTRLEVTTGS